MRKPSALAVGSAVLLTACLVGAQPVSADSAHPQAAARAVVAKVERATKRVAVYIAVVKRDGENTGFVYYDAKRKIYGQVQKGQALWQFGDRVYLLEVGCYMRQRMNWKAEPATAFIEPFPPAGGGSLKLMNGEVRWRLKVHITPPGVPIKIGAESYSQAVLKYNTYDLATEISESMSGSSWTVGGIWEQISFRYPRSLPSRVIPDFNKHLCK